jgi:hypothetical protein
VIFTAELAQTQSRVITVPTVPGVAQADKRLAELKSASPLNEAENTTVAEIYHEAVILCSMRSASPSLGCKCRALTHRDLDPG